MSQQIAFSEENFESIYLVGFRVTSEPSELILYTLVLYNEVARNDQNRPLMHDGRVIFFLQPSRANDALALGDAAFRKYGYPPAEVSAVYDIPAAMRLLRAGKRDDEATVVNLINELMDFVSATQVRWPDTYRTALSGLADYATFSREVGSYLDERSERRDLVLDALFWSIGTIFAHARVI